MLTACDFILRIAAALLCLVAAIAIGVNTETNDVGLTVIPGFPPLEESLTAKWHHFAAVVYLLVANAIASGYAILSSIAVLVNRGRRKGLVAAIVVLDIIVVAILFSSLGATIAIGIIAYKGNTRLEWGEVCSMYERFCHQGAASLGLSSGAAVAFIAAAVIGVFNLKKTVVA